MTTMLPSPFLTESPAPVETIPGVSTEVEAASLSTSPHPHDEAAETISDTGIGDIHEIFHHGRRLVEEGRRREQIDRGCLAAVAAEIAAWQDERDPLPIFLRGRA